MARVERTFTIVNALGLHARAAAVLVQTANRHHCDIQVEKDGIAVNGKSIMGVLTLAASKGTQIAVTCEGGDAEEALEALSRVIEAGFGEK